MTPPNGTWVILRQTLSGRGQSARRPFTGTVTKGPTTRLTAGGWQRTSTSVGPQRWQTSSFRPRIQSPPSLGFPPIHGHHRSHGKALLWHDLDSCKRSASHRWRHSMSSGIWSSHFLPPNELLDRMGRSAGRMPLTPFASGWDPSVPTPFGAGRSWQPGRCHPGTERKDPPSREMRPPAPVVLDGTRRGLDPSHRGYRRNPVRIRAGQCRRHERSVGIPGYEHPVLVDTQCLGEVRDEVA